MANSSLVAGRVIDDCSAKGIKDGVSTKGAEGYKFIVACVKHPQCCLDVGELVRKAKEMSGGELTSDILSDKVWQQLLPPVGIPDITLTPNQWYSYVSGRISSWIDPDSFDPIVRRISEKALKNELNYFSYLGLNAILVPLRGVNHGNMARIMNDFFNSNNHAPFTVWADVPLVAPSKQSVDNSNIPHSDGTTSTNITNGSNDQTGENAGTISGQSADVGHDEQQKSAWDLKGIGSPSSIGAGMPLDRQSDDTWEWFHEFRTAFSNDPLVTVCLELTPDLPEDPAVVERWKGEPLRLLKFHTRTFLTAPDLRDGFPMPELSDAHQRLAKELFVLNLHAIIEGPQLHGPPPPPPKLEAKKMVKSGWADRTESEEVEVEPEEEEKCKRKVEKFKAGISASPPSPVPEPEPLPEPEEVSQPSCAYYDYLNKLWQTRPSPVKVADWVRGYEDYLQTPLQPLGDDLESQIYETFEKDPVKYKEYGRAMDAALNAKRRSGKNSIILMVLGAGRGPLVSMAYEILKKHKLSSFKLYAVEKNQNAVVTLKERNAMEWDSRVEVVHSDMRNFQPKDKADIIVSELLGSFGDNELSPECLDGALPFIKDDCISIPQSYSSFIGPLHSPKLFNEVRSYAELARVQRMGYETAYVVRVHNQYEIAPPHHLFRFDHPNFTGKTNDRYKEVAFTARQTSEIMGIVGYFTTKLYDSIYLSILPKAHTPGMFSWFPIMFPIQYPVLVKKDESIRVRFWRRSNERQIWYEWQLVEPVCLPIMNPGGRTYNIRLV